MEVHTGSGSQQTCLSGLGQSMLKGHDSAEQLTPALFTPEGSRTPARMSSAVTAGSGIYIFAK